eukprot:TRINITY_DN2321_c0_g1_i1.p2 TRINITY_DN2321_c0_g1~~TRINITY_DN2321_c0_g1_i1.p2  ORF type:complete len:108 (+),score=11.02 TRINITY_DN2321_c0_g1_i1:203-526(+)
MGGPETANGVIATHVHAGQEGQDQMEPADLGQDHQLADNASFRSRTMVEHIIHALIGLLMIVIEVKSGAQLRHAMDTMFQTRETTDFATVLSELVAVEMIQGLTLLP